MRQKVRLFIWKILQRRLYDLFANKQSLLLCFALFCMTFIAILHIFEMYFLWSNKNEIRIFNQNPSIADCQLCYDFPIDVVYTWVNGSDPNLLTHLLKTKQEIQNSISSQPLMRDNECSEDGVESGKTIESNDDLVETPIVLMSPAMNNPHKVFDNVTKFEILDGRPGRPGSNALIYFASIAKAREITLRCFLSYNTTTYSLRKTHIILGQQPNGNKNRKKSEIAVKIWSLILLYGIPVNTSHSKLLRYLSPFARKQVDIINIYDDKHIALLSIKKPILNVTEVVLALRLAFDKTLNISQSIKIRHPIDLIVYGNDSSKTDSTSDKFDDLSDNRFADNQELRYSLRSIEQNANWIRNVYIVTNGQIPNWANLDNPRLKIITHKEIFPNQSHLPTFSSPAIETHLHRIPNLSKMFLYLNDDIMFGKPVYPEDFYTKSKGYKMYLSWPVPNCAEGCPLNWLKDGYCDQPCNSSECLWDGGDCESNKINSEKTSNSRYNSNSYTDSPPNSRHSSIYCSTNCVDSWLSDKFCDQVCNNIDCAFDLGDCGIDNFNLIQGIQFKHKKHVYYYKSDLNAIYFNLTNFINLNSRNKFEISEISFENNSFVRSSAMNMNYNTLIFLFYTNQEKENLNITIKGLKNNSEFVIKFQALVSNDWKLNASNASLPRNSIEGEEEDNGIEENENHLTETYLLERNTKIDLKFTNRYQEYREYPKILQLNETEFNTSLDCELRIDELPDRLKLQFRDLETKLKNGILTQKGFKNFKQRLISLYINQLCNYETTIKAFDKTISAFDWEKQSTFADIENLIHTSEPEPRKHTGDKILTRHLMDSYADSLKHVNHLYNQVFGIEMRKVPAHMAHAIDVDIMSRLQNTFSNHFDITSSHRIRSSDDMQFAFAYNYYLMSELKKFNFSDVFNEFDVDSSGTWSDIELRNVMINIYELPLRLETVEQFYQMIFSCCKTIDNMCTQVQNNVNISQYYYRGLDEERKQSIEIPKAVIVECENVTNKLSQVYKNKKQNRFEILGEEDVSFKMIRSNATIVAKELDELNKHMTKFMCLNDNIEHQNEKIDVLHIKRMLVEFYESIFPKSSQFELPFGQTNRFAYIQQYKHYKQSKLKQNPTFKYKSSFFWSVLTFTSILVLVFILKRIDFMSRINKFVAKPTTRKRYNLEV